MNYVSTFVGVRRLNTRTVRNINKGMRKLAQRPYSHATAFRGSAFQYLELAARARRSGWGSSCRNYLKDAKASDEMARYIRVETAAMLPA